MSNFFSKLKVSKIIQKGMPIKAVVAFILIAVLTTGLYFSIYSNDINKGLSRNLIRLHVIANSDSPEDQALKRDVRDVVLGFMREQLKNSKDVNQTKQLLNNNLVKIEEMAKNEIARQGKVYTVKTMIGEYPFPTKEYGDIVLPAGNYQALRVVIGKGEGANWWCVLFPPLCFIDATHGTIPESVKKDLKNVLTKNEYDIISTANIEKEIPIKIKFKIVDFFQDSRIKLSDFFSKIFKIKA